MNVRINVDVPLARYKDKENYVKMHVKGGQKDFVHKALRKALNDLLFEKFLGISDKEFARAVEPYIVEAQKDWAALLEKRRIKNGK